MKHFSQQNTFFR